MIARDSAAPSSFRGLLPAADADNDLHFDMDAGRSYAALLRLPSDAEHRAVHRHLVTQPVGDGPAVLRQGRGVPLQSRQQQPLLLRDGQR